LQPSTFSGQPETRSAFSRHLDVIDDEEELEPSTDAASHPGVESANSIADPITDPGSNWAQPVAASDAARRQYTIASRSAALGGSAPPEPRRRISVLDRGENIEDIQRLMMEEYRRERERAAAVKANERERAEEKLKQKLEQRRQIQTTVSSGGQMNSDVRLDNVDDGW
jgi:hypothetical protein